MELMLSIYNFFYFTDFIIISMRWIMEKLIRNKNSLWFLSGQTISSFGDAIQLTVLNIYIYSITNSIIYVSLFYILESIAFISSSHIAGVFADKFNRKKAAASFYLAAFVLTMILPFLRSRVLLYVAILLLSFVKVFYDTLRGAIIGDIVEESLYGEMQASYSGLSSFAKVLGPVLGAYIVTKFGNNPAFVVNSLTFLYAAMSVMMLKGDFKVTETDERAVKFYEKWREGIQLIWSRKIILTALIAGFILSFSSGIINSIFIALNNDYWQFSKPEFGYLMAAVGIGGILGGIFYAYINKKLDNIGIILYSLIFKGILSVLMAIKTHFIIMIFVVMLGGIFTTMIFASIRTQILKSSTKEERGRIVGFANTFIDLSMLIGFGISGMLVYKFNFLTTLIMISAINIIGAFL